MIDMSQKARRERHFNAELKHIALSHIREREHRQHLWLVALLVLAWALIAIAIWHWRIFP